MSLSGGWGSRSPHCSFTQSSVVLPGHPHHQLPASVPLPSPLCCLPACQGDRMPSFSSVGLVRHFSPLSWVNVKVSYIARQRGGDSIERGCPESLLASFPCVLSFVGLH